MHHKLDTFYVIGIAVRTTNENQKAAQDIPVLWNKFMTEGIINLIPNKADHAIYCIYTDYEKDYTKPYTTILGCKVNSLDTIPEGMVGKIIESSDYSKQTIKGNLTEGIVYNEWLKIWNMDLDRSYTADFEIYDEKAQNPENAEVDIFIAVK
ncbi:GyrI-like domain-containing protein [Elizabethkingia anophelis]|uniref:GyrI-like domain-containing protein n=1 Tax=Elizabethkingia anophelis TaxID=1117645 RepID=UPI000B35AF32|nr:effector binding domain-containing protein [Elizabethkingia anophelis]MCT4121791.1 effector binding domain-containing protein [Elizabethkingia anophelis]MYY41002.1 AraC family transcriptional regulator [Elizabethkingia anophelis]